MRPSWFNGKMLAANALGLGSNPTEGKICFSHFTLLEWNVKKCFVKLIETIKINKISIVKLSILIKILNKKQSLKQSLVVSVLGNK